MRSYAEEIRGRRDGVGRCGGIVVGAWLVVGVMGGAGLQPEAGLRMEDSYDGVRKRGSLRVMWMGRWVPIRCGALY